MQRNFIKIVYNFKYKIRRNYKLGVKGAKLLGNGLKILNNLDNIEFNFPYSDETTKIISFYKERLFEIRFLITTNKE